jgi:hypothetical protein
MATTEGAPPDQPAPPPPPAQPVPPATTAASSMFATFSRAELLLGAGGLLIVATDIVFGMFGPYSFSNVIWVAAAVGVLAIVLVRFARMALPFGYESVLVIAGLVAVISGVRDFVYDVLYLSRPGNTSVGYVLGMVALYVGIGLMGAGAWLLWRRRAA